MGVVEGNQLLSDNGWEEVKKQGDAAIRNWIDGELKGKSCLIVLIGSSTAGRKWIKYEIEKAWNDKKGVLGIYIHNLKDLAENQATRGRNPFEDFTVGDKKLSSIVRAHNPPQTQSDNVYAHISKNIESWVEEAIDIRNST